MSHSYSLYILMVLYSFDRMIKKEDLIESTKRVIKDAAVENGAIVAANSDKKYYPRDVSPYRYVWVRDAAFICVAADMLDWAWESRRISSSGVWSVQKDLTVMAFSIRSIIQMVRKRVTNSSRTNRGRYCGLYGNTTHIKKLQKMPLISKT